MSFFKFLTFVAALMFLSTCAVEELMEDPCLISKPDALTIENLLGYIGTDVAGATFVESLLPGYGAPRSRIYPCDGLENLEEGQNINFSVRNLNSFPPLNHGYNRFKGNIFSAEAVNILTPSNAECQPISGEEFDGESMEFLISDLKAYRDEFNDQYCLEVTLRYRGCPDAAAQLFDNDYNLGFYYRSMSIGLAYATTCESIQYQQFRFDITSLVDPVLERNPQNPRLYLLFDQWGEDSRRTVKVLD